MVVSTLLLAQNQQLTIIPIISSCRDNGRGKRRPLPRPRKAPNFNTRPNGSAGNAWFDPPTLPMPSVSQKSALTGGVLILKQSRENVGAKIAGA
jgi:hypothetical protein